jgi:aryl-alcohol dehydrogenase-like predicted oxidoreductase
MEEEEKLEQLKEELKSEGLELSEEDLKKMLDKINEQEKEE